MDVIQHNILLSCYSKRQFCHEISWGKHTLSMLLSGEGRVYNNEETHIYNPGSIGFLKRNQIAKSLKIPSKDGTPFKTIGIMIDQETLKNYSIENDISTLTTYTGDGMLQLEPDHFLTGFFDSLIPYFNQPEQLTERLAKIKTNEVIELLLTHNPDLKKYYLILANPLKLIWKATC